MTPSRNPTTPRARRAKAPLAAALLASALVSACAMPPQQPLVSAQEVDSFVAGYPPSVQRLYRQVPLQGSRNAALNHMRAGLAALDAGAVEAAAGSFDEVLKVIETIYADNPEAARARSVWYREAAKDFKGEAYERAMAYYYRGLVYMMQGDYQNARASFRGGMLQDSFMEGDERMESDFGALAFLEGWAGRCAEHDRNTVQTSFAEATRRNPALSEPPAGNRLLVLFESGSAPKKVASGAHNEVLRYVPGALPPLPRVTLEMAGLRTEAVQAEDIYFQAATRSGRQVDAINGGKVEYKETTGTAGRVATGVGAGLAVAGAASGNRNLGYAGLGLMAVGLVAQAAANAMQTEADARHWDNLPGNILLGSLPWRPPARAGQGATPEVRVTFNRDKQGERRNLQVHAAGACALAWGREVPAGDIPDAAPFTNVRIR